MTSRQEKQTFALGKTGVVIAIVLCEVAARASSAEKLPRRGHIMSRERAMR
jgi:hypothetical protein